MSSLVLELSSELAEALHLIRSYDLEELEEDLSTLETLD